MFELKICSPTIGKLRLKEIEESTQRHLASLIDGEVRDKETGLVLRRTHYVIACFVIIIQKKNNVLIKESI
jgi:hypothetical protein